MAAKPSIPKGTRDFLPDEMFRRNYIFDTIKKHFKRFAYVTYRDSGYGEFEYT